jgi:hypothetical protein
MDSTRITLPPELQARFATPHNQFGEPVPSWDAHVLAGAGALRSTASDLLKYVSANLGVKPSDLTPLMNKTQHLRLAWYLTTDEPRATIFFHGGGTGGCRSFVGFDKERRRGVVVLTNSKGVLDLEHLGFFLLKSEWSSGRRPTAAKIGSETYSACVGRYQRAPRVPSLITTMGRLFPSVPQAVIYCLVVCGLTSLGIRIWRVNGFRKRVVVFAGAALAIGGAAAAVGLTMSQPEDVAPQPGIGVRHEGSRLLAEVAGSRIGSLPNPLPPNTSELMPITETHFFERLSGTSITFSRDAHGNVTRMTAYSGVGAFAYEKISDQPPEVVEVQKPRVPFKLGKQQLNALVGRYAFAPCAVYAAGIEVSIWREDEQLLWREQGKSAIPGAIELVPESPTHFFTRIDGARLIFIQNASGEATAVTLHIEGLPGVTAKRVTND